MDKLRAEEQCFITVYKDIFKDLWKKKCTLIITGAISFLIIVGFHYSLNEDIELDKIIDHLSNANIAVLSVDIAALAILFGLIINAHLDKTARCAYEEQKITFIGNAFLQLIAFIVKICVPVFCINSCSFFYYYAIIFIQLWALILVFDLIIELYTITSLKNEDQKLNSQNQ